MNKQTARRHDHRDCCAESDCETGLRNNYFEGKRLSVDSFRVEQAYSLQRRRLLNRTIHGWGVVYGFELHLDKPRDFIGPGLALDPCGRELLQTETPVAVTDIIILDEDGQRVQLENPRDKTSREPGDVWWLLSVHYAEENIAPLKVADPCRCEHREWDQTCETVRYSLRRVAKQECCEEFECELECKCGTGPSAKQDIKSGEHKKSEEPSPIRVGKRCLCEHLAQLNIPSDPCGELCPLEDDPCSHVRVEKAGVPLACVLLEVGNCDNWVIGAVEACGPRRLVKRNDLLFDLIRGCDLTHISKISWEPWHRLESPVPFDRFAAAFGDPVPEGGDEYLTHFEVEFSRPVRQKSLRSDCFAMTIFSKEDEGGWWQPHRVPIARLVLPEADKNDCVLNAQVAVERGWVEDALRGRWNRFLDGETRVEIEVRGDFITDCNGQSVDADARGLWPPPTGNGTPGGVFFSTFRVAQAEQPRRPSHHDTDKPQAGTTL